MKIPKLLIILSIIFILINLIIFIKLDMELIDIAIIFLLIITTWAPLFFTAYVLLYFQNRRKNLEKEDLSSNLYKKLNKIINGKNFDINYINKELKDENLNTCIEILKNKKDSTTNFIVAVVTIFSIMIVIMFTLSFPKDSEFFVTLIKGSMLLSLIIIYIKYSDEHENSEILFYKLLEIKDEIEKKKFELNLQGYS